MNKELKKLYYQCKSRGYNESAEQFEKDLARIVIKELRGDDLGKVSGGINGRRAIAGALSAILGLTPAIASAAGTTNNLKAPSKVSRIRPRRTTPTPSVAVASNKSSNQLAKIVFGGGGAVGIVGTGIAGLAYLTNLLATSKQEEEQADEGNETTETNAQDTANETSNVDSNGDAHKDEEGEDDPGPAAPDPNTNNDGNIEEGNHPSEFGEKEQTLDLATASTFAGRVQLLECYLVNAFYDRIKSSIKTFKGSINNNVLYTMYNCLQQYAYMELDVLLGGVYKFSCTYCVLDFIANFMDLLTQHEYTSELNDVRKCGDLIKSALWESGNLADSSYFNEVDKFSSKQLLNFIRACHFIQTSTPLPGEEGLYATSYEDQYFDTDIVGSDWFDYIGSIISSNIFVRLNQYIIESQNSKNGPFDFGDEEDLIDLDQNSDGPSALGEESSQPVDTTNTTESDTPALTAPAEQQKIEQAPQPAESEEPQSITTETNVNDLTE